MNVFYFSASSPFPSAPPRREWRPGRNMKEKVIRGEHGGLRNTFDYTEV